MEMGLCDRSYRCGPKDSSSIWKWASVGCPKGVVLRIEVVYGNGPLWQVLKVWS